MTPMCRNGQRLRRDAQTTVEIVILFVFVIAGITALGFYAERAVQGGVADSTKSFGPRFSLNDNYWEIKRWGQENLVKQQVKTAMVEAQLLGHRAQMSPGLMGDMMLVNSPQGPMPREPANTLPETKVDWRANDFDQQGNSTWYDLNY